MREFSCLLLLHAAARPTNAYIPSANPPCNTRCQAKLSSMHSSAEDGVFSLASVRKSLIRQEETIIFALIERSQFKRNQAIYQPVQAASGWRSSSELELEPWLLENASFLSFMMYETEKVHAKARRYLSPEEHSFFPRRIASVAPVLERIKYPPILAEQSININEEIMCQYITRVVPAICSDGDDEQHGSAALCDIACLQALSRRIHIGKFVAESKFQVEPERFAALARERDICGINELLTNSVVEERVVNRARLKAVAFGQDAFSDTDVGYKVAPGEIVELYRDMIIPLTKQVQVRYLFERCGMEAPRDDEWPASLLAYQQNVEIQSTTKRSSLWM
jgi:chorismate mutase